MAPLNKFMNKKQNIYIAFTCLYMLLLLGNSFQTGASFGHVSSIRQVAHNLLHVPAYFLLALLLFYSFGSRFLVWAFIAASVYGAFNECIQSFIPGRTASIMDMFLNAIGAGIAVFFLGKQRISNR